MSNTTPSRSALVLTTACLASILTPTLALAVQISASYPQSPPLPGATTLLTPDVPTRTTNILDPGIAQFTGTASLAAPATPGSASDTTNFAYPLAAPGSGNPVELYGDAISKVTNLPSGSYNIELTVTNMWFQSTPTAAASEYIYLNIWETFTGITLAPSVTWTTTGNATATGMMTAGSATSPGLGDFVAIEPIVNVYDPNLATWTNGSFFFGGSAGVTPGTTVPFTYAQPTLPLLPFVSTSGDLTIGIESILILNDVSSSGAIIHLPNSLHLNVQIAPIPEPATATILFATLLTITRRRKDCTT
ncbi:MAG: hypothetical protein RLN76_13140 [Phycisphaeraceae bacterium]